MGTRLSRTKRVGFTLIELLVVIAVIAVLASLLLPVLSRTKAAAQSAKCKNNLRQMALAVTMYVDDSDHYLPDAWVHGGQWYLEQLKLPYELNRCPTFRVSTNVYGHSYGYNGFGSGLQHTPTLGLAGDFQDNRTRPTPASAVRAPADMIVLGDIRAWSDSPFKEPAYFWHSEFSPEHGRGVNLAFGDTHIEPVTFKKLAENSHAVRRRWNADNEPHPETWR